LAAELGYVIDPFPPQHMDKYSRNERLYYLLLGMGLIVHPIRLGTDLSKIDHLHVSVALSTTETAASEPALGENMGESAAEAGVDAAMQRSQVADIISPAEGNGEGIVVDFPTVLR
jgi:hypothetical protein